MIFLSSFYSDIFFDLKTFFLLESKHNYYFCDNILLYRSTKNKLLITQYGYKYINKAIFC